MEGLEQLIHLYYCNFATNVLDMLYLCCSQNYSMKKNKDKMLSGQQRYYTLKPKGHDINTLHSMSLDAYSL